MLARQPERKTARVLCLEVSFPIAGGLVTGIELVKDGEWGNSLDIEELFHVPEEALAISKRYQNWICDEKIMKLAKKDAIYMHCLPADRGNEVTDAVIDGSQSVVYQEA